MNIDHASSDCQMEYLSCGCNRTTQALSWSKNNVIAYGGCNSVMLFTPVVKGSDGKITDVLNGHKARVNCVQWLEGENESDPELISGSSDKEIILWQRKNKKWQLQQRLSGHSNSVCALVSVKYNDGDKEVSIITSAASDSTIKVWTRIGAVEFSCSQSISFGNGFAHTLALSRLPHGKGVILACGCDDTFIRLYALKDDTFIPVLTLSGHEDWVRSLAFTNTVSGTDLLLASASQDTYIRLWRISSTSSSVQTDGINELVLKEESFISNNHKFTVVLESVLIGHEGWIYGVSWGPLVGKTPALLSVSMDKTMIIWEFDEENHVWIDQARMGDVGGNTLGYYGCAFGPDNKTVISHGYQGAFKMWKKEEDKELVQWQSCITVSGHFGEVEDFDWDPAGEFAITASTDQTTRLFAPWRRDGYAETWHEIARPQVHGYDMKCIAMLNRYKYAAGAQEKVVRVFDAPKAFYDSFSEISQIHESEKVVSSLPLGATVPVLGLSNKAVYEGDIQSWDEKKEQLSQPMKASAFANEDPAPFNPTLISEPPVEDILLQNTLWPETQKLYGHGFELFTLAASPDGTVLATSCKASKADYANIIIWDTSTWSQKNSLFAHTLTVTQMCFSPCGEYLLSVSRDRTWALHKQDTEDKYKFNLIQKTDKKSSVHTRIIWSCDWSHDSKYFATVSRDKKVLVWGCSDATQCWSVIGESLDVGDSVTAVSICNTKTKDGKYIIAVGLDSGGVSIYTYSDASLPNWNSVLEISKTFLPAGILLSEVVHLPFGDLVRKAYVRKVFAERKEENIAYIDSKTYTMETITS